MADKRQEAHAPEARPEDVSPTDVRLVGRADVSIWTTSPAARLVRAFTKAGARSVEDLGTTPPATGTVVLVRADAVLDTPIVEALLQARDIVLVGDEDGEATPLAAVVPADRVAEVAAWLERGDLDQAPRDLRPLRPADLGASYWRRLRKREVPYAMRATPERRHAIEWRIFMGTYKGATDLVTKWLWPVPAFRATKLCVRLGITPNMVTLLSLALVLLAYVLFLDGQWALGLAAAWLMTFLDTVDGKLARVTMNWSTFGDVLDHGIDLVHPPFWYYAWWAGLPAAGAALLPAAVLAWALGVTVVGYVLLRAFEGVFKLFFGIQIHVWRRFDTRFRLIVSRRNPNIILLTAGALGGRPDLGLLAVAIWTGISVLVHLIQLAQAVGSAYRSGPLRSWLAEDAAA